MSATGSERRHRAKLHYLARGRADAVAALEEHFGWRPSVVRVARQAAGVEHGELVEARERRDAYREDV